MKELIFQVEFLSDIVLPASSNTEGNIEPLDFIPGNNFLGMVAKNYDNFSNSFDIFHSGKVRFGDATLLVDGEETYKMPFSFFHPKLDETKIYHHHFISQNLEQPKQMQSGYILADLSNGLKVKYLNYNYAQKSAYDAKNRRSKTSSMYGYKSIEAGRKWQFTVKHDEKMSSEDIKLLKETLIKSKRLGKSKSSQYGQIKITEGGEVRDVTSIVERDEVILYAKSRIALVDEHGNATYDLKYLFDGIEIDYPKCQIKTSTFTPYNGAMQTKTYERLVIEKGSVIIVKKLTDEQRKELETGVGLYLSEGFGELLINPSFLMQEEEIKLDETKKKSDNQNQREKIELESKYNTVNFLINRNNREIKKLDLANEIATFIRDNKSALGKKMNSQWGTIRSLTLQAQDADVLEKLLFEDTPKNKPKGFLMSKRAKDKWDSTLIDNMKKLRVFCSKEGNKIDYIQFIRLLAIDAPKQKEEKTNDK